VSRATVSFVLNATPNQTISPATRERVLQAVRDLGYKPHSIAKALREGASRVVIMHIDTGLEGNYSRSYIRGLDQELGLGSGDQHIRSNNEIEAVELLMPGDVLQRLAGRAASDQSQKQFGICFADGLVRLG